MSRITVTEKEHWKQRIEKRVDKALEAQRPDFMAAVKNSARSRAMEELGIADLTAKHERLTNQKDRLEEDLVHLTVAIEEHILGKADSRIRRMTERFEDEQLAISETGKEILRLRKEKEALLDTVWLATRNCQIRDLWFHVSEVLGDAPTDMQQQLLNHVAAE